jgi:hypothetical protein
MIISLVMPDAPLRARTAPPRERRHRRGLYEQAGQDGDHREQQKAHMSNS